MTARLTVSSRRRIALGVDSSDVGGGKCRATLPTSTAVQASARRSTADDRINFIPRLLLPQNKIRLTKNKNFCSYQGVRRGREKERAEIFLPGRKKVGFVLEKVATAALEKCGHAFPSERALASLSLSLFATQPLTLSRSLSLEAHWRKGDAPQAGELRAPHGTSRAGPTRQLFSASLSFSFFSFQQVRFGRPRREDELLGKY